MPRTRKQTKQNKLNNNRIVIYQENQIDIDNVINELKQEYEIIQYTTERNNFNNNILYTLKISFIINTKRTFIFITILKKDTVDTIVKKIKNRLETSDNIQCYICCNEFTTYNCSKLRITCSQCNLIYCFNCFKKLVIYGSGIIKCPCCRKITDTTLQDSEYIKLFLNKG